MVAPFDLIVVGGGSGGVAAARRAALHGARVLLFDAPPLRLGGTCVNAGCVPKKLFWVEAEQALTLRQAHPFFKATDTSSVDSKGDINEYNGAAFMWEAFKGARAAYIRKLNDIYAGNLERDGVSVKFGEVVVDGNCVLCNSESHSGKNVLLASGSRPILPTAIPGFELGITSDDFFALEHQPRNVAIVGSGYIAVELAGILGALGSKVSIFVRTPNILTHFDEMLQRVMAEHLTASRGIRIHFGVSIVRVEEGCPKEKQLLTLSLDNGATQDGFDCLIWAIGRGAITDFIRRPSLKRTSFGHLAVDGHQQCMLEDGSPAPGFYAVGDVTGDHMLTPVAIAAGRRLADRLFGPVKGDSGPLIDRDCIPSVLFSHPPVGTIGLTEAEARKRYSVSVYETSFVPLSQALLPHTSATRCHYKLVCDAASPNERILGLHIFGEGSDEALQGFAVAMTCGAGKRDFDRTIAIHPTASEELVTLK